MARPGPTQMAASCSILILRRLIPMARARGRCPGGTEHGGRPDQRPQDRANVHQHSHVQVSEGEIRGQFLLSTGSQTFTPPASAAGAAFRATNAAATPPVPPTGDVRPNDQIMAQVQAMGFDALAEPAIPDAADARFSDPGPATGIAPEIFAITTSMG